MNDQKMRCKWILKLAFFTSMVSILSTIGCDQSSQQRADEYSLAYDSTCKLAYILWLSMPGRHAGITPQIETFLQSNQYEKISDTQKQQLMREIFECARKASGEQSFESGQAIAQGTINVVTLCSLYCFPECKEFCNESNVPIEKSFDAFQKLADRGKTLWIGYRETTIQSQKQQDTQKVPAMGKNATIDADIKKKEAYQQLYGAVAKGQIYVIEAILDQYPDFMKQKSDSGGLITHATFFYQIDSVKLLIARGADVNEKSSIGTPMHVVAWHFREDIARVLIDKGADIMALDGLGRTPLHYAVRMYGGNVPSAKFLLEHGAQVNAKDANGFTPLHDAAVSNNVEMVELLLEKGADANAKNKEGKTPLQLAVEKKKEKMENIVGLLRKYGAKE